MYVNLTIIFSMLNGLPDYKKHDDDFLNVFLYETSAKIDLKLSGYISHNFHRHIQNRRAKRNSGGVAVFYREELHDGITSEKNIHDTIIWLKLDKTFFHLENDNCICGVYLWCEESPMYNLDLFDALEESDLILCRHHIVLWVQELWVF